MTTIRSVSCVFAILAAAVTGCGGSVTPLDEGGDGSGGAADGATGGSVADDGVGGGSQDGGGGSGNAPGSGGTAPVTGGASGTGGEPPVCCNAVPVCGVGELEVESESDCPIGGECYSSTLCCSTVWCMKEQALCDAIPTCASDETKVEACLEGRPCVKRALCGEVITCQKNEAFCDLDAQPNRKYLGHGSACDDLEISCPAHTTPFADACGCGCEQPDDCPLSVSCLPGGGLHPLCNSDECPYTQRPQ